MEEPNKHLIVEFLGGYWDGKCLDSHSKDTEEAGLAKVYYSMTHDGEVGKGFYGFSDAARKFAEKRGWEAAAEAGCSGQHTYRVFERFEYGDGEVLIRLKYSIEDHSAKQ